MEHTWFKNYNDLAKSDLRKDALAICDAGLDAISTQTVIERNLKIENNILFVKDQQFDLSQFKTIKVIGFGKAACDAAVALEKVLGQKISEGVVIGLHKKTCDLIQSFEGTHPRPSEVNARVGEKIFTLADGSKEDDLVIVVVSGGGSALLCYPESECTQGAALYDGSIISGIDIEDLNTVRKHISSLKGGGLAQVLYPATVVSLIFSDVPGDDYGFVASGPTYYDSSTMADAQAIIDKHNLGHFDLVETPKDQKCFEKVHNIPIVSNKTAADVMIKKAQELGYIPEIASYGIYNEAHEVYGIFKNKISPGVAVIGAGEPEVIVTKKGGSGGRNLFVGMLAIKEIVPGSVFIALASDGMDNSDSAGALVDTSVAESLKASGIDIDSYLDTFDAYGFFKKLNDGILFTGATGANVSDLFLMLTEKKNKQSFWSQLKDKFNK